MSQPRVFVSHSSSDNAFCEALVKALREAGADVWYDQHNLGAGKLLDTITHELKTRPIFVVIVSPVALESQWVQQEIKWAWKYYTKHPNRSIVPVVCEAVPASRWDDLPYLDEFVRIEGPGNQPYEAQEAIAKTLALVAPQPERSESEVGSPPLAVSTRTLLARGRALVAQERHEQALPLLAQATQQSPKSFLAWFLMGYVLGQLKREEEALHAFERATALRPDDPAGWYNTGLSLNRLGRYPEALIAFDRALALDPDDGQAWTDKGIALARLGRHEVALEAFERATVLDPDDAVYWDNRAVGLCRLRRFKEALPFYERALRLNPKYATCWSNKGLAL
jgi:tetratricopeptide (TPR) repeat protein